MPASSLRSPFTPRAARLECTVHHLGLALGGRPGASFAQRTDAGIRHSRSGADCLAGHLSLGGLRPLAFAETNPRAAAVLVDEIDAGHLKRPSEHRKSRLTPQAARYLSFLLGRLGGFAAGCFRGNRRI